MRKSIICVATPKFRGNYLKSTVQLTESLSTKYDVLYIDYPHTFTDVFKMIFKLEWHRLVKLLGLTSRIEKVRVNKSEHIHLLTLPPIIPVNRFRNKTIYDLITKINTKLVLPYIRGSSRSLNFHKPIIINAFQPFLGLNMIGKLNEKANIYYCYDEISEANWLKNHGKRYEEMYMKKVDGVIVTSKNLFKKKSKFNPNVSIIHNGVDFKLFNKPVSLKKKSEKKSIIGYIGTVDDRIDVQLMEFCIKKLQKYEFQFIGRCVSNKLKQRLKRYSNVHFMGSQKIQDLPVLIENMSVCIIPFVSNSFTNSIYPLKINEYLARGKAVVSTLFTDLSDFSGYIYTSSSAEQFCSQILIATEENNLKLKNDRIQLAFNNSWANRAKEMSIILDKLN